MLSSGCLKRFSSCTMDVLVMEGLCTPVYIGIDISALTIFILSLYVSMWNVSIMETCNSASSFICLNKCGLTSFQVFSCWLIANIRFIITFNFINVVFNFGLAKKLDLINKVFHHILKRWIFIHYIRFIISIESIFFILYKLLCNFLDFSNLVYLIDTTHSILLTFMQLFVFVRISQLKLMNKLSVHFHLTLQYLIFFLNLLYV